MTAFAVRAHRENLLTGLFASARAAFRCHRPALCYRRFVRASRAMTKVRRKGRGVGGWLWPRRDYYGELQPEPPGNHPIDRLLERSADVRSLNRQVLRLQRKIGGHIASRGTWSSYEEARGALSTLREELAFNIGFELGAVNGRGDAAVRERRSASGAETAEERAFRLSAQGLLLDGSVGAERRLLIFIEMAWALAMGSPSLGRPSRRRPAAAPQPPRRRASASSRRAAPSVNRRRGDPRP